MQSSAAMMMALASLLATAATGLGSQDGMHPRKASDPDLSLRAGRVSDEELEAAYWMDSAQSRLSEVVSRQQITSVARNVIMFLGDGMSLPTVTAARILLGQTQGQSGEEAQLSFDQFPHLGISKTYCVDSQTADSACSATAYLAGVKANRATIGVTAAVGLGDCLAQNNSALHVSSIAAWAQAGGKATGVVTTSSLTDASPAGLYAHTANRDWETDSNVVGDGQDPAVCRDVASQLVDSDTGRGLKVILGGGRGKFTTERSDGRNLIAEWLAQKEGNASYVSTAQLLQAVDTTNTDHLLGLFADGHLDYHLDADGSQPRLADMTRIAIQMLSKQDSGYFLFVEGARIDMGHHANQAYKALDETLEFSEAVQAAVDLTDEQDTLIVVTADHAHTMSVSGYPQRGNDILGIVGLDDNNLTRTAINYANGPSYQQGRNITENDNTGDKEFEFPSAQYLSSETHGGDDVGVFSRGPWSHLLTGVFEQNYIPHVMAFASCVGDGLTACDGDPQTSSATRHNGGEAILASAAAILTTAIAK